MSICFILCVLLYYFIVLLAIINYNIINEINLAPTKKLNEVFLHYTLKYSKYLPRMNCICLLAISKKDLDKLTMTFQFLKPGIAIETRDLSSNP